MGQGLTEEWTWSLPEQRRRPTMFWRETTFFVVATTRTTTPAARSSWWQATMIWQVAVFDQEIVLHRCSPLGFWRVWRRPFCNARRTCSNKKSTGLVVKQQGGYNQQRKAQKRLQRQQWRPFPPTNNDLQHHHHRRQRQCLLILLQKNANRGQRDTENRGFRWETATTPLVKEEDLTNQQWNM